MGPHLDFTSKAIWAASLSRWEAAFSGTRSLSSLDTGALDRSPITFSASAAKAGKSLYKHIFTGSECLIWINVTGYFPNTFLYIVFQHSHLIDTELGKDAVGIRSPCFINCIFGLINTVHINSINSNCRETLVFLTGFGLSCRTFSSCLSCRKQEALFLCSLARLGSNWPALKKWRE